MSESKLDRWTQYAAILGAFVTAGSMSFGVMTYRRTAMLCKAGDGLGREKSKIACRMWEPPID